MALRCQQSNRAASPPHHHSHSYAFVYLPSDARALSGRNLEVAFTSPTGVGGVVAATSLASSAPEGFFASCPTRNLHTPSLVAHLAPDGASAALSFGSSARGVWLGVTTWATTPTLTLTVSLSAVVCTTMSTSTLTFCRSHLPDTVETPTVGWPGAPAATLVDRDDYARAVATVVGSYTSAPCGVRVASVLCAQAFPTCSGTNITVLPVCTQVCDLMVEACADFAPAVGVLGTTCGGVNDDTLSTCYGLTSGAAAGPGWGAASLVVAAALPALVAVATAAVSGVALYGYT